MIFQKLLPPVWFLLSIILMVTLHLWLPVKQLFIYPLNYLGLLGIVAGVFLIMFCAYIFKSKETTIIPFQESSYLLTEGIFNYSRNPIYLGMMISLLGLWLFLGSLTPILVIPAFIWLIQEKFIKQEEAMLKDKFGDEYQAYIATVRRWI